ncbi:uncharacterized protein LOC112590023 isoform X1 [Harpegnathos saltator]|uniref:uncharacterized protein LOC112590023 isoform X1 n=1 Tax=Harpegnathos saltator TaxID=610380 RepID=UPI000DBEEED2|nr:uncharacterized protein LOC112590023 isoform X1 [Harpegnathos saltator]
MRIQSSVSGSEYDHLPGMTRESRDDEARERKHVLPIENYIPFLITALQYARIWPAPFSVYKIALLTGLLVILFVIILANLLAEIVLIIMGTNVDDLTDIIGVITAHIQGLLKWWYFLTNKKELFDIMMKLNKCHVFCQRIDKEGT